MNLKYHPVILLYVLFSYSACRSSLSKIRYEQRRMHEMAVKYNLKLTINNDRVISDSLINNLKNYSMKEIKRELDNAERGMVLIPDSVGVIYSSSKVDIKSGVVESVVIDTKTRYIFNKNKIRYIKKHHISVPGLYIVDK